MEKNVKQLQQSQRLSLPPIVLPGLTTRSASPGFAENTYQTPKETNGLPNIEQMRAVLGTPSLFNNRLIQTHVDLNADDNQEFEIMNRSLDSPNTLGSKESNSLSPRYRQNHQIRKQAAEFIDQDVRQKLLTIGGAPSTLMAQRTTQVSPSADSFNLQGKVYQHRVTASIDIYDTAAKKRSPIKFADRDSHNVARYISQHKTLNVQDQSQQ